MSSVPPVPAMPAPLPGARRGLSSGLGFTITVSVLMGLGALVMALLLLTSGAPSALVVGTVLAFLPVVPLLACYMWLDRYEPEPRSLLALGLGWGAFVATSSALFFQLLGMYAFGADRGFSGTVLAPVTEEAGKGLFVLLLLWFRRHELDGILDGIVYAGMAGIGFAFTENILYLGSAFMGEGGTGGGIGSAIGLFIIRGIMSPFAHPLFTAFTGIGVGLAITSRNSAVRVLAPIGGYLLAVAAHAAWNGSIFIGGQDGFMLTYAFLMIPAFLLLVGFAVWSRAQEGKLLTSALTDAAQRGLLHPAEVPWLVRLPARRAARRHAALAGGPVAGRAMKDYQRAAVELGFLHHRYLRGTAPKDYAIRGQLLLETMQRLRPMLVWPGAAPQVQTGTTGHSQQPLNREGLQ